MVQKPLKFVRKVAVCYGVVAEVIQKALGALRRGNRKNVLLVERHWRAYFRRIQRNDVYLARVLIAERPGEYFHKSLGS